MRLFRGLNQAMRTLCAAIFAVALAGAFLLPSPAHAQQLHVTYAPGRLTLTIPYHASRDGGGRLVAEVLDPEDHVLGHAERAETIHGDGTWHMEIVLEKPVPYAEIVWHRVRYHFDYSAANSAAPSKVSNPFRRCSIARSSTSSASRNTSPAAPPPSASSSTTPLAVVPNRYPGRHHPAHRAPTAQWAGHHALHRPA